MTNLYLTNMGSSWSGGTSINSISMGDSGQVFLAGSTSQNGLNTPVIKAYKDGVPIWQSGILNSHITASFNSVFYKNGYIYAAGGIKEGFNNSDLQIQDFIQSKPANIAEPDNNYYGFFSKFDAITGQIIYTKVLESVLVGNSSLSVIKVDEQGNIYTSGTNIAGDSAVTKFSSDGDEIFEIGGGNYLLALSDDGKFTSLLGSELVTSYSANGVAGAQISGWIRSLYEDPDSVLSFPNPKIQYYLHGSLLDNEGNIYFVYTQDIRSKDWMAKEPGTYSTVLMKVSQADGHVIWNKTLDSDGFSEASSLVFDANGNLLVSGYTVYDLRDQKSSGGYDAFISTLNPLTGDILSTKLIGSSGDEVATQAMLDINKNLYLSGTFASKFYDLKNSGFENIYLISDDGFTLLGDDKSNEIQGGNGSDSISGGSGNDLLYGGLGNDQVDGGIGNDKMLGGQGSDFLNGGTGVDELTGGAGNDKLDGGANDDLANYSSVAANLTINLATGVATGEGTDTLISIEDVIGGSKNDTITGNSASNEITAGSGDDYVDAAAGDDLIVGGDGAGNDRYIGGTGIDTIKYTSAKSGITVNLAATKDQAKSTLSGDKAGIGIDQLSGIENIIAGNYDDQLTGNSVANTITAGSGNDVIDGGAENDTLTGGVGNDTLIGGLGADTLVINAVVGSSSDSSRVIIAGNENDTGQDKINGFEIASDTLKIVATNVNRFEHGVDTALGNTATIGTNDGTQTSFTNMTGLIELNQVTNSNWKDLGDIALTFTGAIGALSEANFESRLQYNLTGTANGDTLTGGSLSDTLNGGLGNDTLIGGLGNDTYIVDSLGDITTETSSAGGIDIVQSSVTRTLGNYLENLTLTGSAAINGTGNALNNTITGNGAANILNGGTGADTLIGGLGNDTYVFTDLSKGNDTISDVGGLDSLKWISATNVMVELQRGGINNTNLIASAYLNGVLAETTTVLNQFTTNLAQSLPTSAIETLNLFNGGISANASESFTLINGLTGGSINEVIVGTSGNDVMNGSGGLDMLFGGLGNDTLSAGDGGGLLNGGLGNDRLLGGSGMDILIGGAGDDALYNSGNTDILEGGSGNDIYYVNNGVTIHEYANSGTDTINTTVSTTLINLSNIENITFTGNSNLWGTGNNSNNVIIGNYGSNTLNGGAGNDTLNGGAGNDTLNGGTGNDVYCIQEFRGGNDTITDSGGNDILQWEDFNGANGVEFARSGNNLVLSTYAIWNDGQFNNWNGIPSQVTTIKDFYTASGFIETFQGKHLNDPLLNFNFAIDNLGVASRNDIIVGSNSAETLDGKSGNDFIFSGLGNDVVMGGDGNDGIVGGLGADSLRGGNGADRFIYAKAEDSQRGTLRDIIRDFSSAQGDKIDLVDLDANTTEIYNNQFSFSNTTATANSVWFKIADLDNDHLNNDIIVFADINGNTTAEFEIGIIGATSLTASDFVL